MFRRNWLILLLLNRQIGCAVSAFAVVSLILSCGYRLAPSAESVGPEVRKVFVESFGNKTDEAKIENIFRSAFIEQFVKGGKFSLARGADDADAILSGQIMNLTKDPLSYRRDNMATEERITVVLDLTLRIKDSGKVVWTDREFSGNEFYTLLNRDLRVVDESRREALAKLARDSAERAYGLMMSGF